MHEGEHGPRVARQQFLGAVPEVALAQSGDGRVDGDEERGRASLHRAFEAGGGRRRGRRRDRADTRAGPSSRRRLRRRGSQTGSRAYRPFRPHPRRRRRRPRRADRTSGCCRPARARRAARGRGRALFVRRSAGADTAHRGRNITSSKIAAVLAQRDLAVGAAVDVVERHPRQAALGQQPEVGDVEDARGIDSVSHGSALGTADWYLSRRPRSLGPSRTHSVRTARTRRPARRW